MIPKAKTALRERPAVVIGEKGRFSSNAAALLEFELNMPATMIDLINGMPNLEPEQLGPANTELFSRMKCSQIAVLMNIVP